MPTPMIVLLSLAFVAGSFGARRTGEFVVDYAAKPVYHHVLHPVGHVANKALHPFGHAVKKVAAHQVEK